MKFPGNLYGQGGKAVPRTVEEDLRIQVDDLTAKLERLTQEKDEQCKAKEVFFNGMNDIREQREALRREVAELTRQLDAQHAEIRDMRKSIDTAAKGIVRLTTERDDLTAKLAAGRQWTNEQPRTPGWYWWKGRPDVCPDVHYVSEQDIAEGNPPGLWCGPLEAPR